MATPVYIEANPNVTRATAKRIRCRPEESRRDCGALAADGLLPRAEKLMSSTRVVTCQTYRG